MVNVKITFDRLNNMPTCEHGRVQGFCECWRKPAESTDNSIASAMRRIGADFAIPIRTRRMYAEQDQRDYLCEFDYIGRVNVELTAVERVKRRIFMAVESSALGRCDPMSKDAVY